MILILEDDADRERFQRGHPFNDEFFDRATMRIPTVWISPEAYAKDVLADLRARAEALPTYVREPDEREYVILSDVLALFDGSGTSNPTPSSSKTGSSGE